MLDGQRTYILAHRCGAYASYIENTKEAASHAVRVGADIIEIDVARSKDGTIIGYHGGMIEQFGRCHWPRRYSFKTIQQLRPHIQSLKSILSVCKPNTGIYLDIKDSLISLNDLRKVATSFDHLMIGVSSEKQLERYQERPKQWRLVYDAIAPTHKRLEKAAQLGVDMIGILPFFLSAKYIERIREHGFLVALSGFSEAGFLLRKACRLKLDMISVYDVAAFLDAHSDV